MTARILALTAAVLLVSCHDAVRPSFDFVNGPGSPGNSGLFRFQGRDFFIAIHEESGLITVHGLQNTFADLCAGLGALDLVDFQLKPQTAGEIQALIKNANSSVQIVPLVAPTCAALSAAPVLYRGTASLQNTDNNFTPTGSEGERANSFGWVSLGVLDDLTHGGQVRYQEVVRRLVRPSGDFAALVSRLNLTPVSAGGLTASIQSDALGTEVVTGQIGPGSVYRLDRPEHWNGRLVLYAHGAVPPTLPIRLPPDAAPLRDALVARGYGFAYSSRSETGWAVKDGVQRTRQLRGLFAEAFGEPQHTYVMGASMGGAIALMLAETNPGVFDGALGMCTITGGTQMGADYVWNVRVLFDYFFPGVIPGDALHVPQDLAFARDVVPAVRNALLANPTRAMEMAGVDQIEIPVRNLSELVSAMVAGAGPLGFQVNFTNDFLGRTHGHSWFDNTAIVYTGSQDDAALNAGVGRFSSTPDATNYLGHYYQPDGNLTMPVLTLHGTRDPLVPFAHEAVYAGSVAAQGKSDLLVQRTFDRFGHCGFGLDEQLRALEDLAAWAETGVRPAP